MVLRQGDLFEVTMRKLGLHAEDNLQVCGHPIVFGRILSVDLTHQQQRAQPTSILVTPSALLS